MYNKIWGEEKKGNEKCRIDVEPDPGFHFWRPRFDMLSIPSHWDSAVFGFVIFIVFRVVIPDVCICHSESRVFDRVKA